MKKLVIVPAYNEEASIIKTINNLEEFLIDYDFIVINDGSTDKTALICKENGIPFLDLGINLGIGGAVQTGYLYAWEHGYNLAVQFDGDGQHDAKSLKIMEKILLETKSDMVIGSRFIEKKGFQSTGLRRFAIRYFTTVIRVLTGRKITDPTSGLRMGNEKVIEKFALDYPKDYPEPETVVSVLKDKMKVMEIPVVMKNRQEGNSTISPIRSVYYMFKVTLAIFIECTRRRKACR